MTAVDYPPCEDRVLAHEGSEYTDGVHPYDPGGPTRWGITIGDARSFWKPDATANDVRTMPRSVAQQIYRDKYWAKVSGDALPAGVDDTVFDYGVNSGNSRAGKVLRRVLGLPDTDWHVTPLVIAECNKRDPKAVVNAICDERLRFLQGLGIWPIYKNGWTTRIREVRLFSTQLADHSVTPTATPLPTTPTTPTDPQGKGTHPPPNKGPIITGGGAATVASGGLIHWLGAHPALTAVVVAACVVVLIVILNKIQASFQAKQDAPTPGLVPVPPALPAILQRST